MSYADRLEDLKKRCFKDRLDPSLSEIYAKDWALVYPLKVTHWISIRIVLFLESTPIRPDWVSYTAILIGVLSSILFAFSGASLWIAAMGALLFEVYYILDAVDGQLARAKKMTSFGGAFLDEIGNVVVAPLVLFGIGFNSALSRPEMITAFLAGFSVLAITAQELYKFKAITLKQPMEKVVHGHLAGDPQKRSVAAGIYSFLYRMCTMPVIMNVVTASVLAGCIFQIRLMTVCRCITLFYAFCGMFILITKVVRTATKHGYKPSDNSN